MARITEVGIEARNRLIRRTHGYEARAPFRAALAKLTADRSIELTLEDGETPRKVKLQLARAAKEINRSINYGQTEEGSFIVWLEDKPKQTRRPRKSKQG